MCGICVIFCADRNGSGHGSIECHSETIVCLLATPCFMESLNVVMQYESALKCIQWNNLNEHVSQFSMGTCLTMLFIDCIIYSLLTLYLDSTWPTRFRQKRSIIFPRFRFDVDVDDSHESLPEYENKDTENDRTDTIEDIQFEQAEFALEHRNIISILSSMFMRYDIKGIICQVILPAALVGLTDSVQIQQRELHIHPSSQLVGEYTDTVMVPMSQLDTETSVNVSNFYYTYMQYNWPTFWKENMQTNAFGHNISYSIGVNAAADLSCLGRYQNFHAGPNCTAAFQESIYHYSSDDNIPYFGFWFTPIDNEVLFGFNSSAYHSLPMAVNVWNNWVLRNVY